MLATFVVTRRDNSLHEANRLRSSARFAGVLSTVERKRLYKGVVAFVTLPSASKVQSGPEAPASALYMRSFLELHRRELQAR